MFSGQELDREWKGLNKKLANMLGKEANVEAVLFLIGIYELGEGSRDFTKEEKQDLMHIGSCKILSYSGYYKFSSHDNEGWPHWELVKDLPSLGLKDQEHFIKWHILRYFEENNLLEEDEDNQL